jgi:hypothetical protein
MSAAKERLGQLMALAAERQWSPLARELCDLAIHWPADYPEAMRAPMAMLFQTALREADGATQAELAGRLSRQSAPPLALMNVLYLAAPAPLRREILMRNEMEPGEVPVLEADSEAILAAARDGTRDFAAALGFAGIPYRIAQTILADPVGEPLAVLCRGLGFDRAIFSALALLRGAATTPLAVFDTVAPRAAARLVQSWRRGEDQTVPHRVAAAE